MKFKEKEPVKIDFDLFPFPKGLKKQFNEEELDDIEKEGNKLAYALNFLVQKKLLSIENAKEYYNVIMHDKYFDLIIENTKKRYVNVTGRMKEIKDVLIEDMEHQKEETKEKACKYKKIIEIKSKELNNIKRKG